MVNKTTNIRISIETKKELEKRGKYGETMDIIIKKIIKKSDNNKL